jgi:hypothetical protein
MPAGGVGQVSVLDTLAKAKATESGGEGGLGVSLVRHGEAQDAFSSRTDQLVKLDGLVSPLAERGRPHEVHGADDAERHPEEEKSRLRVLKVHKLLDSGTKASKELLLHKVGHELVTSQWNPKHLDLGVLNELDLAVSPGPFDLDGARVVIARVDP